VGLEAEVGSSPFQGPQHLVGMLECPMTTSPGILAEFFHFLFLTLYQGIWDLLVFLSVPLEGVVVVTQREWKVMCDIT